MKVLISAGPTREALDPVRFFSNRSTGAMGILVAEAALRQNHVVTLLLGPTSLSPSETGINVVRFESAADLAAEVKVRLPQCDAYISTAAVADYRPKVIQPGKIKKHEGDLTLVLERTEDVLAWAGQNRRAGQVLIGFALETDPDPEIGRQKLLRKRCDMIVHNSPVNFGAGGGDVRFIRESGIQWHGLDVSKDEVARRIVAAAESLLKERTT